MSEDAERRIVALEREVAKLSEIVLTLTLAKTAAPKAAAKKKR